MICGGCNVAERDLAQCGCGLRVRPQNGEWSLFFRRRTVGLSLGLGVLVRWTRAARGPRAPVLSFAWLAGSPHLLQRLETDDFGRVVGPCASVR